jgi:hypothetical protein
MAYKEYLSFRLKIIQNMFYSQCLIEAFDSVKFQSDVTIHCKNKTQLKTSKLALIFSSKLFAKIFADSESNQFQRYDVLCPGTFSRLGPIQDKFRNLHFWVEIHQALLA